MTRHNFTKAGEGMGEVFSRVNKLAHQLAVQEEMRLRSAILVKIEEARDKGASIADLKNLVAQMEAAGVHANH